MMLHTALIDFSLVWPYLRHVNASVSFTTPSSTDHSSPSFLKINMNAIIEHQAILVYLYAVVLLAEITYVIDLY